MPDFVLAGRLHKQAKVAVGLLTEGKEATKTEDDGIANALAQGSSFDVLLVFRGVIHPR